MTAGFGQGQTNPNMLRFERYLYIYAEIDCSSFGIFLYRDAGYSGIQRRDPPWVIFSAWDYNCQGSTDTSVTCIRAQLVDLGPGVVQDTFGGEGTGQKTYLVLPWSVNRTHALLLAASRRAGSPDGRDCSATAFYRSEAREAPWDVGGWAMLARMRFGCDDHPLAGAYSFVEDWTGNGRQRAAAYGPALFRAPGGEWTYAAQATFTHDIWWAECEAEAAACHRRRDGVWERTPSSAVTGAPRFKLVTGSVTLPCPTHAYGDVPAVDSAAWPEAPVFRGALPDGLQAGGDGGNSSSWSRSGGSFSGGDSGSISGSGGGSSGDIGSGGGGGGGSGSGGGSGGSGSNGDGGSGGRGGGGSGSGSGANATCPLPPAEVCCSHVVRDPAKTQSVRFGAGGHRAISSLSVWRVDGGGAGGLAVTVEVAAAGTSTGCTALPLAADLARPGWSSGPLVCGAGGDSVSLSFAGAGGAGSLGVRLCTVAAGASSVSAATLSVRASEL